MQGLKLKILAIVERNDGQCSWYQMDRALTMDGLSTSRMMADIRSLKDAGWIEEWSSEEGRIGRYFITDLGREVLKSPDMFEVTET